MSHLLATKMFCRKTPTSTWAAARTGFLEFSIDVGRINNGPARSECLLFVSSCSPHFDINARHFGSYRQGRKGSGGGARGTRSRGWLTKYREGRGGRHLPVSDDTELEQRRKLNDFIFSLNKKEGLSPTKTVADKIVTEKNDSTTSAEPLPTKAYLDISIDGTDSQRVTIELASAVLPKTVGNFLSLCEGVLLKDESNSIELGYKNTRVHHVEKKVGICFADALKTLRCAPDFAEIQPGGCTFKDEGFYLTHSSPGMVSMISPGVHRNGSRFIITTNIAKHLDGKYVSFGKVIDGMEVIMDIGTNIFTKKGVPTKDVVLVGCGVL
mmetsp:Transcript_17089/g.38451  ORF Transcript_17089/g.38451 Transcript_17089/m.38451 type:complete len:325 (-) Transcript_17089:241-1215(-)|eukprot:CAMPEP_0113313584 /NCGR_PEP_ID=MMETSP0010_2-20120614/9949_1 /TAXON_ID=216773 ORGANISM="Corethron hystrix, Strain 308" /NCGR_SAMPLE_ID=MMETSP0010_2 /ASSEMBLY_ACC=CAM_ASM_000155 /LENGTH=324 /DNA_ID=CAMNT_0000169625 /DNA_START=77 /DNA_END=1051 /DNA_ORIENTATION=- /assembly_acc=CAM_ASM_000155